MPVYVQVSLNVTSAATMSPIAGASVFINGTINFDPNQFTVVTDVNGNATFQVATNLAGQVLQVRATGFQTTNQLIATGLSSQFVHVVMQPEAVPSAIVNVQFVPMVPGIVWQVLQGLTVLASGVSDQNGASQSNTAVTNGSYTFTATLTGFQSINQPIVLNGQSTPYTFTLIENTDSSSAQQGNSTGASNTPKTQPSSNLSQTAVVPPVSNEYIYPNTDYDKYFTITGVCIYIGNLFIDECNSIQYAVQDNAIPIYGYASRFVDAYGQGRSLVQGQLTLNFVTEGYLFTVLKQYKQLLAATQTTQPKLASTADLVTQILGMMATRDSYLQQVQHNPNSATTTQITGSNPTTLAANLQQQISSLMLSLTPDQMNTLSQLRLAATTAFTDPIPFDNAVYQDVLFDIRITMGNEITGVQRVRYIEKCKLISNEQVIAPDGQTILDSYGFIGRRLR
jgi:hypothetical protein